MKKLLFLLFLSLSAVLAVKAQESTYPYKNRIDRDPFEPVVNDRGMILIKEKKEMGNITLQGIIYSPGDSAAIIDNELWQEGEIVGDCRIQKIEANGIFMEKEGKTYFLKWEE